MTDPKNDNTNNVTPDNNKFPVSLTPASQKKPSGRFSKVKKTPDSQKQNQQTVKVVLVKPDAISETSVYGLVITPTGFMMDKFLGDVFYKRIAEPLVTHFIKETGCIHRCFSVLDNDGEPLKKENKGKFYDVKSCFIPVDDPDDLEGETNVKNLVNKVADNLWSTIDKKRYKYVQEHELPRILDYERDVRTVTNYSDVFSDHEDTLVSMALTCKKYDCTFADWIKSEGDDNVYTIFHRGKVPAEKVAKWNLPFDNLDHSDKKVYQKYQEDMQETLNNLTTRKLTSELEKEVSTDEKTTE